MFHAAAGGGRLSEDGRSSFQAFKKAAVLKRVERVCGSNPAQESFRRLLSNVRNGTITRNDYLFLSTRLDSKRRLTYQERRQFAYAARLVASHIVDLSSGR